MELVSELDLRDLFLSNGLENRCVKKGTLIPEKIIDLLELIFRLELLKI